MNLTPDILYERQELLKKVSKFKLLAIFMLFLLIIFVIPHYFSNSNLRIGANKPYIARINIEGMLTQDQYLIENLNNIIDDKSIKAVIVNVNSQGGTAYAGESIYNAIRKIAASKPTVSVIGTLATSAGYMVALASDHIISGEMSITGSIGVILQTFDVRELMTKKLGVTPHSFKSSPLKASPSPFEEVSPEAKQAIEDVVKSSFDIFKKIVKNRRKLSDQELNNISDGRIFTGSQALKFKLVDQIGMEDHAVKWLITKHKISSNLKVIDYDLYNNRHSLKDEILHGMYTNLVSKVINYLQMQFLQ